MYDITAALPDIQALFEGADLTTPDQAAEMVTANMLSEVIELIGRFSPWYKAPASAFGLIPMRDDATKRLRWVLSSTAIQQRQEILKPLSAAIKKNIGLILSVNLISDLEESVSTSDPRVMACCLCAPPRVILVQRSVLASTQIVCDACQQPFRQVGETSF
jgi:hypothetical protein